MWDKVFDVVKVISIIVGLGSGAIVVYITSRLTPLALKLAALQEALAELKKHGEDQYKSLDTTIEKAQLRADSAHEQISKINCDVCRAETARALVELKLELREEILARAENIAEANSSFREDMRNRLLTDERTLSREAISREAVEELIRNTRDSLEKRIERESSQLHGRIGGIESRL